MNRVRVGEHFNPSWEPNHALIKVQGSNQQVYTTSNLPCGHPMMSVNIRQLILAHRLSGPISGNIRPELVGGYRPRYSLSQGMIGRALRRFSAGTKDPPPDVPIWKIALSGGAAAGTIAAAIAATAR